MVPVFSPSAFAPLTVAISISVFSGSAEGSFLQAFWNRAVVFIAFNTFVNIRGIQMSRGVDWVIFVIEVLAVIAFIALGCNFIMGGGGAGAFVLDPIYQEGQVDAHFIAAGISLAALSFLGFDGMSTLAEETH